MKNSFEDIPDFILNKWQQIADLLAEIVNVPAALIMKEENECMEVFVSSNSKKNPYHVGEKEKWYGLYCETVIKSKEKLKVSNAIKDDKWAKNPDLKLGMLAYLGFPINFPDSHPFGTICILDDKENDFSLKYEQLLFQFKNMIELDLALIQSFDLKTHELVKTITEQQKDLMFKNEELLKSLDRVKESDRLKTAFLKNISHEIRTPMNAIIGFSDILLQDPNVSNDERSEYLQIITGSANKLLLIVENILTVSSLTTKQEKIKLQAFCLNDLLSDLILTFEKQALEKDISLTVSCALTNLQSEMFSDQTKLTQILSNLLINALKFTQKGSVEFGYKEDGANLQFFVKDSGIGIKKEDQEKIFDFFTQVTSSDDINYGTGLGLSIAKGFVELLGGEIWVESEPNKGAVFYFNLPFVSVH
jgi:signal transduction histidine kinase